MRNCGVLAPAVTFAFICTSKQTLPQKLVLCWRIANDLQNLQRYGDQRDGRSWYHCSTRVHVSRADHDHGSGRAVDRGHGNYRDRCLAHRADMEPILKWVGSKRWHVEEVLGFFNGTRVVEL